MLTSDHFDPVHLMRHPRDQDIVPGVELYVMFHSGRGFNPIYDPETDTLVSAERKIGSSAIRVIAQGRPRWISGGYVTTVNLHESEVTPWHKEYPIMQHWDEVTENLYVIPEPEPPEPPKYTGRARMLDLNTMHMPGTHSNTDGLRSVMHTTGLVVFVQPYLDDSMIPEWLREIHKAAVAEDCILINFDQAARVTDRFKRYRW